MGEKTAIEWADTTINTAWGCTKVSAGCEKCYMFRLSKIFGRIPDVAQPRKLENIEKELKKFNDNRIIFLNSMTDTFHESYPFELIHKWFDLLEKYNNSRYIILTKRINKAYNFFKQRPVQDHIWIGTSIENKAALHRLAKLKLINCKTRFLSLEPLLEDLGQIDLTGIHWVIVGGESDFSNPRPFNESWARNIKDQCKQAGIPFFYKQSGGKTKNQDGVWGTNYLDGKQYLEIPIKLKTKTSQAANQTTLF